jgi:hypothetical protein
MIAETWPDTFETIEATRDPVKITFNERISERTAEGGNLDNAVIVSPFTGEHRVKKTRSGLEIDVIGGFQPGLVYRVRVLPIIQDLFNNAMEGPFELVFSTGAPYEQNVVAGIVSDRISGEVVSGVRVEARARGVEDPPVHVATSDTAGVFALRYLPAAAYDLAFFQDVNRNAEPDYRELQELDMGGELGTDPSRADTLIIPEVQLLRPDTVPARLIRAEALDSLFVRLAFDKFMDAEGALDGVQVEIAPEEGPSMAVDRLLWSRQVDSIRLVWDSIAAEERQMVVMDSLQVVADSLSQLLTRMEAADDSLGVDTVAFALEQIQNRLAPPEEPEEEEETGPEAPPPPILPEQEIFVLMGDSLAPNQLLSVTVSGIVTINEVGGGGGEATFAWEPPERAPEEEPDTLTVVPDTAGVAPDTTGVPPDTTGVPPDTTGVPPDTTALATRRDPMTEGRRMNTR